MEVFACFPVQNWGLYLYIWQLLCPKIVDTQCLPPQATARIYCFINLYKHHKSSNRNANIQMCLQTRTHKMLKLIFCWKWITVCSRYWAAGWYVQFNENIFYKFHTAVTSQITFTLHCVCVLTLSDGQSTGGHHVCFSIVAYLNYRKWWEGFIIEQCNTV